MLHELKPFSPRGSQFIRQSLLSTSWSPLPSGGPRVVVSRRCGRTHRHWFTTLSEVLEAAKEGDGAPPEASSPTKTKAVGKKQGTQDQEGVIWFSNIYPTKVGKFDFRQVFTHHNHERLIPQLLPEGVKVMHVEPREREGGAFVWFNAPPAFRHQVIEELKPKREESDQGCRHGRQFASKLQRRLEKQAAQEDALGKVIDGISQYCKIKSVRAFLCPFPVRAHRVEGEPYLEDLQSRYPGSTLQIRIAGGTSQEPLREEQLFMRLRRYGQLVDIQSQPDGEGFRATFRYAAAAIAARNCLHRARADADKCSTRGEHGDKAACLHIEFEAFMRKWLQDFIINNARIAIPFLFLFILSTTYFIWDPMRMTAVQLRVAGALQQSSIADRNNRYYFAGLWGTFLDLWGKWQQAKLGDKLGAMSWGFLARKTETSKGLLEDFWSDRRSELGELMQLLNEPQDRVMLLTGPRGNGQGELVRYLLDSEGSRGAVLIDVGIMLDQASDEHVFLRRLCRSFGYAPAPLAERHLSALLDMTLPGSGKLGRSDEVNSTVQRVLSCTTQALLDMRARRRTVAVDISQDHVTGVPAPLFVIDGFTSENKDRYAGFFELLVSWAAYVTDVNLARVLFIADSSFAEPTMLAALKNRPEKLEVHQLRDADLRSVTALLERQLGSNGAASLSVEDLLAIGGRFRDVASLVAHVKEGEAPAEAVRRLVEAAAMTVRTLLVYGQVDAHWTRPQLWRAVRLLAKAEPEGVPYDTFLWSVFRGDEAALRSMLQSNLIAVSAGVSSAADTAEGMLRRRVVQPGSPLYAEVYRRLIRHPGHSAVLDLEVAKEDIKREQAKIDEYEVQLVRLQEVDDVFREKGRELPDPNKALLARKEQLLELIQEQHGKLQGYHKARKDAMKVLHRLKQPSATESLQASRQSHVVPERPEAEKPGLMKGLWGVVAAGGWILQGGQLLLWMLRDT